MCMIQLIFITLCFFSKLFSVSGYYAWNCIITKHNDSLLTKHNTAISKIANYPQKYCQNGYWNVTLGEWVSNKECPLIRYSKENRDGIYKCLHNKTVVIIGNSVSRHLYVELLAYLHGLDPSPATEANRHKEKEYFFNLTTKNCPVDSTNIPNDMCFYNMNHFENIMNATWNMGAYNGKIQFIWMWDWYHTVIKDLLLQPNVIVTSNAGLNRAWAHYYNWSTISDMDALSNQFPLLWHTPIHPTSQLIYRQSTCSKQCLLSEPISMQNAYIRDYIHHHNAHTHSPQHIHTNTNINRYYMDLDVPTSTFYEYLDTNHHPGKQSALHIDMLLTIACQGK